MSFDFNIDKNTTINLYTVPYYYNEDTDKYAATYKVMYLGSISTTGGFTEYAAKSILGTDQNSKETFITADKIKADRWNSIQLEACGKDNTIKVHLNGVEYNIPTQTSYIDGDKTCSMTYGYNAVAIRLVMAEGASAYFDNAYIQVGVDGAPLPTDENYATDHATNGHIGAISDHTVTVAAPTVTSAYGVDARQKGNNLLYYKKTDGKYVGSADVQHFYVKPNATASDAIANTKTSNSQPVSFFSDANLTTKYTGEETLPDECIAIIPLIDGDGTIRAYTSDYYSVGAGAFDFGHSQMNNTSNIYYSVLGFNPTITSDEAKSLFNGKKLVLPDSFGGLNVGGIAHYAFYKEASGETPEVTYPEIDFDLSQVKSSGECWPGQFSFSKTGITKVEISARGYIQQRAFQDCDKLTYVDLTNCAGGQWHAFRFCDNLTTVKADDLKKWTWGGCVAPFADCPNFNEITFNSMDSKTFIDYQLLQAATSLKTIKVMDAADSNKKYLDNNVNIYAAAYDESGKMISISLLKKVNESDNFKTLSVPQTGKYIKIFQLAKSGNLVPATSITTIK